MIILALIVALSGAAVFFPTAATLEAQLNNRLRSQAQILGNASNGQFTQGNLQKLLEANPELKLGEREFLIFANWDNSIAQLQGPVSAETAQSLVDNLGGRRVDTQENYHLPSSHGDLVEYRVYSVPVLDNLRKVGTLILGLPREDSPTLRNLAMNFIIIMPGILLVAALGGYWIASRAMRPVRAITQTARAISESDLSRRLNLRGHDEIAELAATFDQMLVRLEQAFRRQQQFTSDASHELRTPLTIINLEVDRVLTHRRTPEEYEHTLSIVQAENEYMTHLVNDLLTLARADAGKVGLKRDLLDLSDITLEAVERLLPLAQRKQLELVIGALPELPIVGDRLYLLQMLTNVIENAIKYTHQVGHCVRVEAGRDQAQGWVRVIDDGPGIASEYLAHLFDRFYRVDRVRTHDQPEAQGGSGLGLSIAQWIAHSHGGQITVQSQIGSGSTFKISLPL